MATLPSYFDWLTLLAILAGPLLGIWATRLIDRANDAQRRKEAVLEGLIKTRGLELSPEHVSNLNMIPLVFQEVSVRAAYSALMAALNTGALKSVDEAVSDGAWRAVTGARQDLIREIAKAVRRPLPENEIERLGYAPEAWANEMMEQTRLRRAFLDIAEGRRPLPMIGGIYEIDAAPGEAGKAPAMPPSLSRDD